MTMLPNIPPPIHPQCQQSVWPKVIGIVSICWASLGLMCQPISLIQPMLQPKVNEMFPPWYMSNVRWMALGGIAMGIVHLIGGIMLLRRKPAAKPLLLVYSIAAVVLCVVNIMMLRDVVRSVSPELAMGMRLGMFFGGLGAAYPVFLIVWLLRPRIAREIRSWNQPAPSTSTIAPGPRAGA